MNEVAALEQVSSPPRELRRTLTYYDLVIYGLAYVAPFAPLQTIGFVWKAADGLIVLVYLLGAVCMYFTAKSYAVMTDAVPSAGSVYGFARHALGPFAGFVAGWMLLFDYLLIPAYIYVSMAVAMSDLVPQVDRGVWISLLCAVTLGINWFGVTVTSRVNLASVGLQLFFIVGLLVFAVAALHAGMGTGALTLQPLFAPGRFHFAGIFTATSICVMSFLGFDAISTLGEEVKGDDRRVLGRAIVSVLILSAALFVLVAWVLGNLMSGFAIHDPAAAIYELCRRSIGPWAAVVMAWAVAIIIGFSNALPMQVGVARVLFAMGRDHQLPSALAALHPKYGTPYVGMLVTAALSLAVAVAFRLNIDELVSLCELRRAVGVPASARIGDRPVLGPPPLGTVAGSSAGSAGRHGRDVRDEPARDGIRRHLVGHGSRLRRRTAATTPRRIDDVMDMRSMTLSRVRARDLGLPLPCQGRGWVRHDSVAGTATRRPPDLHRCHGRAATWAHPHSEAGMGRSIRSERERRDDRHPLDYRCRIFPRTDLLDEHPLRRNCASCGRWLDDRAVSGVLRALCLGDASGCGDL